MATPPTFTNGTPLYQESLNSIGLWLVKSQAIGTSVSSFTLTNVFSSDYDAYRIVLSGYTNTASDIGITCQLNGATGNTYAYWLNYWQYGAAQGQASATANSSWILGWSNANGGNLVLDIVNPNKASYTSFTSTNTTPNYYMAQGGTEKSNTQFTGFTFACSVPFTGGDVRIYGYRK
jgi:hypothetical protein